MGAVRRHKVCSPVAGRPAIVRLLDTLRSEGVSPIVVVVGHQCGDVVETVGSAHPEVHFVFQRDRLGTGHAARIGIEALARFGLDGDVLVTMGDKHLARGLVSRAHERFRAAHADLLLVSVPKGPDSSAGRLVRLPGGGIGGNVELRDIQKARILRVWLELAERSADLSRARLRAEGLKFIRPAAKLWKAMGRLAGFCRGTGRVVPSELAQAIRETGLDIAVCGRRLSPEEVERRSSSLNASVYIGRMDVLQSAVRRIGRDNAQDEYYLTDIIALTARPGPDGRPGGRVVEYRLRDPSEVMAFNNRAELRRIDEHVRGLEAAADRVRADARVRRLMLRAQEWSALLDPSSAEGRRLVSRTYGTDGSLCADRLRALRQTVRLFATHYGPDRRFFLVRAPGRVNLMGRHIDHQGGFVHAMAIDSEVILAAAPRDDDVIRLVNADPSSFPRRELVVGDWLGALNAPDWLSFVNGTAVRVHLMSTSGDWSNYVLASALFRQFHARGRRLRGFDAAVVGNVPMAAGLSSSSALVVAAMEAVDAANGGPRDGAEVVGACGQAEWFVGSRGGAADHAAIRLGRAGRAARMAFHPFRVSRYVPVPPDAAILVAASGEHAVKSAGARDRFNERVACYRIGMMLLRRAHPRLPASLEYVRDIAPDRAGLTPERVRALLRGLPERISRQAIRARLGRAAAERLEAVFASHADPGAYAVRAVMTYGVGEYERSRIAAGHLERHDLEAFGRLMRLSHDGDRVAGRFHPDGERNPAAHGPLHRLIGAYGCSTRRIDCMVDIALSVEGVYGAQLVGAGLGGCITVLAERSAVARVRKALAREYYEPLGLAPAAWEVRSVSGGGLIVPR